MFITTTTDKDIIRTSVDDIKRNITPLDFVPDANSDTIRIPLEKVGLLHTALLIDPVAQTARIDSKNADYINILLSEQDKQSLIDWLDSLTIHTTPIKEIKARLEKEATKNKRK